MKLAGLAPSKRHGGGGTAAFGGRLCMSVINDARKAKQTMIMAGGQLQRGGVR